MSGGDMINASTVTGRRELRFETFDDLYLI